MPSSIRSRRPTVAISERPSADDFDALAVPDAEPLGVGRVELERLAGDEEAERRVLLGDVVGPEILVGAEAQAVRGGRVPLRRSRLRGSPPMASPPSANSGLASCQRRPMPPIASTVMPA